MGWWKRRSQTDFSRRAGARWDLETDAICIGYPPRSICRQMLQDLPLRIDGRGALMQNFMVKFLEKEFPGISYALYEWSEPGSTGELIGELLSSWRGPPRNVNSESEEDT